MPLYNNQTPPPALFPSYPQNKLTVFNAETVLAGEYSQQFHIPPSPTMGAARGLRITIDFSATPGNFEFDVCEDDTDSSGSAHYAQIPTAGAMTVLNTALGTQCTLDIPNFQGQFGLLYVKTAPSNGNIKVTATVTRT